MFGNPQQFAIEVYRQSPAGQSGFGRIAIHIAGQTIGDISSQHCGLDAVADRFDDVLQEQATLKLSHLASRSETEIYQTLDRLLYIDDDRSDAQLKEDAEHYMRFNFLTGASEAFDEFKSFIFVDELGMTTILFARIDEVVMSGKCTQVDFTSAASRFLAWHRSFQR